MGQESWGRGILVDQGGCPGRGGRRPATARCGGVSASQARSWHPVARLGCAWPGGHTPFPRLLGLGGWGAALWGDLPRGRQLIPFSLPSLPRQACHLTTSGSEGELHRTSICLGELTAGAGTAPPAPEPPVAARADQCVWWGGRGAVDGTRDPEPRAFEGVENL